MAITILTEGRRHYLQGLPYGSYKDRGANWDPDRKMWWTGKREVAEALASSATKSEDRPSGADTVVAGRATYKGRNYFIVGRVERGRTSYDDLVKPVTTRDGGRVLLSFTDGSSQFWADRSLVQTTKTYDRPQTIGRLAKFAAERQAGTSRQDFEDEIEALEDQDNFAAARRLETAGYSAWRAAQESK